MGEKEQRFNQFSTNHDKIVRFSPNQMEAWNSFSSLIERDCAISPRRKELIAVAISAYAKCDMSIACHVKKALQLGATRDEIIEATWVAVLMGGDPVLMYAQRILLALEEYREIEEEEVVLLDQAQLAIDSEYKKLYFRLIDYLKCICNEVEGMFDENKDRVRIALKITESDGSVLKNLVLKECDRRGWEESQ